MLFIAVNIFSAYNFGDNSVLEWHKNLVTSCFNIFCSRKTTKFFTIFPFQLTVYIGMNTLSETRNSRKKK